MKDLKESYTDFNPEDVEILIKYLFENMSKYKQYASSYALLEKMNLELNPYGFYIEDAELASNYDNFGNQLQWNSQHILYGATRDNGTIVAVVAISDLVEDIQNDYKVDWDQFVKELITVFTHEYTHQYQLSKYKDLENNYASEYQYLTDNGELAARAFAGAKELLLLGYSKKDLEKFIKNSDLSWMIESDQLTKLHDYLEYEDSNSKILRKFKKYMVAAIDKLED